MARNQALTVVKEEEGEIKNGKGTIVYVNMPKEIGACLTKDAKENMRPKSVQIVWIISQYYAKKKAEKSTGR